MKLLSNPSTEEYVPGGQEPWSLHRPFYQFGSRVWKCLAGMHRLSVLVY